MNSIKCGALASAALLTLAGALPASATTIDYTVSGIASGLYTDGPTVTPFTDVDVVFQLFGDTANLINVPGIATGIQITSATLTASGILGSSPVQISTDFLVLEGSNAGIVIFGTPPFTDPAAFSSPAFVGYDGISNLGPISITYDGNVDPDFANGADARFTAFTDVTFTAQAIPEPATWALMLLGFGGLGAGLRRRRAGLTAS